MNEFVKKSGSIYREGCVFFSAQLGRTQQYQNETKATFGPRI